MITNHDIVLETTSNKVSSSLGVDAIHSSLMVDFSVPYEEMAAEVFVESSWMVGTKEENKRASNNASAVVGMDRGLSLDVRDRFIHNAIHLSHNYHDLFTYVDFTIFVIVDHLPFVGSTFISIVIGVIMVDFIKEHYVELV